MTGRISFIKADRTFGFLKTRDGEDLFVGARQSPDFDILAMGQVVRFEIAPGNVRRQAINVMPIGKKPTTWFDIRYRRTRSARRRAQREMRLAS